MIWKFLSGDAFAYLLLAESLYALVEQATGTFSIGDLLSLPGFVESLAICLIGLARKKN
jgi:hypothetical protein